MAGESFERKKMTDVYILEILRRYTDDTYDSDGNPLHAMTQTQIAEKLLSDYDILLDRKAVSRGLSDLTDSPEFCEKIEYDIEIRKTKIKGKITESEVRTNYRFRHDFDAAQIRWLMDAVLFSRDVPAGECKGLLEQISKLGNIDSRSKLKKNLYNLSIISADKVTNQQLLYNIEVIDEAIEKGRQVAYIYNNYGKNKKLHPRTDSDGNPIIRIVNPYSMIASNGRYYLICNYDEYDNATNVRVDKITDIELLNTPAKPKKNVRGLKNVPATIAEQMYMQPGAPERIVFRIPNNERLISEMIDWFGNCVRFTSEDEKTITCEVKANPNAMKFWAMQYSDNVEIIEPESLRENIRESLRSAWRKYNDGKDSLIETEEGIRKLIADWETLCNNVTCRKEEDRRFDIRTLGDLVRKTHIILLPFFGQKLQGQYAELMLSLKELRRTSNKHMISDAQCISLIIGALIDETENPKRNKIRGIPEDILPISTRTHDDGRVDVNIDINNFEEDYLTLKQYTDKSTEEARIAFAEFYEKYKERRTEQMKQRRKEKEEAKKSAEGKKNTD